MLVEPIFLKGPPGPYKRRGAGMSLPGIGGLGGRVLEKRAWKNLRIIQEN
jgi:hypothetical protein